MTAELDEATELEGHWLLGHIPELARDPLALYTRAFGKDSGLVRMRGLRNRRWYFSAHPHVAERVLQGNGSNYRKPDFFLKPTSLLGGQGLLTGEGEFWLQQRRLAQPAFHRERLASLAASISQAIGETSAEWSHKLSQSAGRPVRLDVHEEMARLTLRVASRVLFSADLSVQAESIAPAVRVAFEVINYRMTHLLGPPLWMPTPRHLKLRRALSSLDSTVLALIRARRARSQNQGDDLLGMLMAARGEDGQGMSDAQLRDEVMTLMIAGYETTGSLLSWAWLMLSRHVEVRERLQDELERVLEGRAPQVQDLPRLSYARMVIDETLRLYPPAWVLARQSKEADCLLEHAIPAGAIIILSPYLAHRHAEFWERPEEFDPERFSPEQVARRPRFAYFPFGGGARICIGRELALMEAQLTLAILAQRFHLEAAPGYQDKLNTTFTLSPRDGLPMTLHAR